MAIQYVASEPGKARNVIDCRLSVAICSQSYITKFATINGNVITLQYLLSSLVTTDEVIAYVVIATLFASLFYMHGFILLCDTSLCQV